MFTDNLYIDSKLINDIVAFAKAGHINDNFMNDLLTLADDAKLRPYKNYQWEISRLFSKYRTVELLSFDSSFQELYKYIIERGSQSAPVESPLFVY